MKKLFAMLVLLSPFFLCSTVFGAASSDNVGRYIPPQFLLDVDELGKKNLNGKGIGRYDLKYKNGALDLSAAGFDWKNSIVKTDYGQKSSIEVVKGKNLNLVVGSCPVNTNNSCIATYNENSNEFWMTEASTKIDSAKPSLTRCSVSKLTFTSLDNCITLNEDSCKKWNDFRKTSAEYKRLEEKELEAKNCSNLMNDLKTVEGFIKFNFTSQDEGTVSELQKSFNRTRTDAKPAWGGYDNPKVNSYNGYSINMPGKTAVLDIADTYCGDSDEKGMMSVLQSENVLNATVKSFHESFAAESRRKLAETELENATRAARGASSQRAGARGAAGRDGTPAQGITGKK